jgi:hypothetical protein
MNNKTNEQYYVVRTDRAGVFFGQIKERNGSEVTMTNCRKIWSWDGATETLGLATHGVKYPDRCKFTVAVAEITVLGVIEIIPCTEKATESLRGVREWKV